MKPLFTDILILLFCILSCVTQLVDASAGDRTLFFRNCLFSCNQRSCGTSGPDAIPSTLELPLRLTRWSCSDNCAYWCMHQITDKSTASGKPIVQYYGKWPFWRFLGMQEPASVLFSLLNLWVHVRGYRNVVKHVPDIHPTKNLILLWSVVNMRAWIWSAVFHTRGMPGFFYIPLFRQK